jgi:pimeloyl-ACP methyl ester carboxylesterase
VKVPNAAALKKAGIVESFFHTGEVKIHYAAGPANGDPIVFIPGQSCTWEEYVLLLPLLATDHQVYAISLPGHGQSSWTPGKYTFNQLGAAIAAFIRGVVRRPAIVAGNSSGGVLTVWLAANEPELVRALVLEDPPLFRCEWPTIKSTVVYDAFLGLSKMAIPGGGGFSRFFADTAVPLLGQSRGVVAARTPPKTLVWLIARLIAVHQALIPGAAIDVPLLPIPLRVALRGLTQFDGNFSQAFVDGTVGAGFDHATALRAVTQPTLFLHANWFIAPDGRLLGAVDDDDVAKVKSLIGGPFDYLRVDSRHATPLDIPEREATEIRAFKTRHDL